jgi:hypothetical protein
MPLVYDFHVNIKAKNSWERKICKFNFILLLFSAKNSLALREMEL